MEISNEQLQKLVSTEHAFRNPNGCGRTWEWMCDECCSRLGARKFPSIKLVDPQPDQCYECHRYHDEGDQSFTDVDVDADPGDPEVGPQPDIMTVKMCMACVRKNTVKTQDAATQTGMYDHDDVN